MTTDPQEARRLAALRQLDILDTPAEARFDRITRLALRLFDVPLAFICLADAERAWIKSAQGLQLAELPREATISNYVVTSGVPLVVENLRADERFAQHPLVTGEYGVAFYAGHPLRAPGGEVVGSLCVFDRTPHAFDEADLAALADLAAMAEAELGQVELAVALRHAEEASRLKGAFLADLCHELRTPLNAVIGYSELLQEDAQQGGLVGMGIDLGRIRDAGRHLLGTIDEVLDLMTTSEVTATIGAEEGLRFKVSLPLNP
jgi:GAF domain-containing protein